MNLHKNWIKTILVLEMFALAAVLVLGIYTKLTKVNNTGEQTVPVVQNKIEEKMNVPKNLRVSRIQFSDEVEELLASLTLEQKVAHIFLVSPEALTGVQQVIVAGGICEQGITEYPVGGIEFTANNYREPVQFSRLISGLQAYSQSVIGSDMMIFFKGLETEEEGIESDSLRIVLPDAKLAEKGISRNLDFLRIEHGISPELTGDSKLLCSFSPATTNFLRGSLNYKGLIISGPLNTQDITSLYSAGEAAIAALEAGMDILYHPADFKEAYQAVLSAVVNGDISKVLVENAVGRILTYTKNMNE